MKTWRERVAVGLVVAVAVSVMASPAEAAHTADWPQPGGGAGHRNWNRDERAIAPRNVARLVPGWAVPIASASEPIVVGRRLFTTDYDLGGATVTLQARDADSAAVLWTRVLATDPALVGRAFSDPMVVDGRLLFVAGRTLRALDPATGVTTWRRSVEADRLPGAVFADGGIVAWSLTVPPMTPGGPVGNELLVMSTRSGALRSRGSTPGPVLSVHGGVFYYRVSELGVDGVLATTLHGARLWRFDVSDADMRLGTAIATSDTLYVGWFDAAGGTTGFHAVNTRTGRLRFTGGPRVNAVDATKVYTGASAVNRWTGRPAFANSNRGTNVGSWATVGGGVLFASWCSSDDRTSGCGPLESGVYDAVTGRPLGARSDLEQVVIADGRVYARQTQLIGSALYMMYEVR